MLGQEETIRRESVETAKIFCHHCGGHTNHKVIATEEKTWDPDYDSPWGETHYFARCAGCDSIVYAIASWEEGDWDPHTGNMDLKWQTYPKSQGERLPIKELHRLPKTIRSIYRELVGAMNAQLPILAAIGLRVLIETICREREVEGDRLVEMIGGLAKKGVLSASQAEILHGHRFLGNIAAHEVISAEPHELVAALDIAETILKTIYVLPHLSKEIETGRKP